ncbi:MAG: nitrate reductase molybdenum cofactor assembly chaperone [Desulfurella sp.]|uniref:nitrate reductase molybdenum cofactor assembly chaperone n=1 Tax=Desulfurella sp. TaxID=1962857 RepID=UPI003D1131F8
MKTLKLFSVLLLYPGEELTNHISEFRVFAVENKLDFLMPLLDYMEKIDILDQQKHYTFVFDLTPSCSLYLLEHFKDDKTKGQKLLDFIEKYSKLGLKPQQNHTPDFLPMYLEYLSFLKKEEVLEEIAPYKSILANIYKKLQEFESPYRVIFEVLSKKEVLDELP